MLFSIPYFIIMTFVFYGHVELHSVYPTAPANKAGTDWWSKYIPTWIPTFFIHFFVWGLFPSIKRNSTPPKDVNLTWYPLFQSISSIYIYIYIYILGLSLVVFELLTQKISVLVLEILEIWITPSLSILPGPLWSLFAVFVWVLSLVNYISLDISVFGRITSCHFTANHLD